jgi:hypothetical protein
MKPGDETTRNTSPLRRGQELEPAAGLARLRSCGGDVNPTEASKATPSKQTLQAQAMVFFVIARLP